MSVLLPPYNNIILGKDKTSCVDHMGGFDVFLNCPVLTSLNSLAKVKSTVDTEYIFTDAIKSKYNNLDIKFNIDLWTEKNSANDFQHYTTHPYLKYKNFICSFNGSPHVCRKLLVTILERFGYFNPEYCSKNFTFTKDQIEGHIVDYVGDQSNFYYKFFIENDIDVFCNTAYSFGHARFNHKNNIYNLENKLTQSFLHVVSETMASSYFPFVTEKFLYSVVTRGLFLAYAQPGWHTHVEKYYGFKKYNKIFNYTFDSIQNPVERLVELITMISKFSILAAHDWHDLYLIEQDTVEYNYDHYFSGNYLKYLEQQTV
jgi:hypothetical protein